MEVVNTFPSSSPLTTARPLDVIIVPLSSRIINVGSPEIENFLITHHLGNPIILKLLKSMLECWQCMELSKFKYVGQFTALTEITELGREAV